MHLVKDRSCGECSVCCVVLNVDTREFQKLPGVPCAHLCEHGGCSIHTSRYPVCREYHCGWRYLESLGDEWRPDRSGVLIDFQTDNLPAHYPKRPGVRLMIVDKMKGLDRPFYSFVARLIAADVPVILSMCGPPGHFPAGAFLNDALKEPVSKRDLANVEAVFAQAQKGLESHRFNRVVHQNTSAAAP
ncbi:MAG: hypothetical protein ACREC6_02085 [Hyphomicrobiaceae bacterium]